MVEPSHRSLFPANSSELETLQRRAYRRRTKHRQFFRSLDSQWQQFRTRFSFPGRSLSRVPARFLLHTVVALLLPIAVVLSSFPVGVSLPIAQQPISQSTGEFMPSNAPVSLDQQAEIGDAPLDDNGSLPVPISLSSQSAALGSIIVQAAIAGERVYQRNGPGTQYDQIGRLSHDTNIQVIGKYGDWFLARERVGKPTYWIAAELVALPEEQVALLPDILEKDLPLAPPPKVGLVRESNLSLRDGPGTNYVSIAKLDAGVQLDMLERYQDWYHVAIPGGADGWVRGDFLTIETAITQRLLEAESIPDPNPALIGTINDNSVNLRKGPDSKYVKISLANAGTQVDLLGKYKDWFKVRLPGGVEGWVFSDLLNASAHVVRRVPFTKNFPALPTIAVSRGSSGRRNSDQWAAALASIRASGDVASYAVQFVGSRYVYGGASPSGFDCSGFISYVYRQFGASLPHSAAGQYSTAYGVPVGSMDNLAAGDLVFFQGTTRGRGISHVALYIGGGRVVHAMTPRLGVQVSNIYDSYWVRHFYSGLRVKR